MQTTKTDELAMIEGSDAILSQEAMLLSYIRPLRPDEGLGFAVCSEEGSVLGKFSSYEAAYFTARQFRLEPLYLQ